ncbi:MAG: D-2-hydroxyacid dehydrogenase, partial [Proteobacteria bacterium]|nr:D-2-hydroxyacid dehydrogenase [Pseudomonadota bacterium]
VYAEPLAEFVIGSCIYFAKDFPRLLKNQKSSSWESFESELVSGKTLGIFGYGEIGRSIAKKASALGMNVIAVRRRKELSANDPYLKEVYSFNEADKIFSSSDYLVSAAPLTDETKGFINKSLLTKMKSSSVFLNVGRGPVVLEEDLIEILQAKKIKGAALDVFEVEPLNIDSPLWKMDNVLISPHIADRNTGWLEKSMQCFIDNCKRFIRGEELQNVVDIEKGY